MIFYVWFDLSYKLISFLLTICWRFLSVVTCIARPPLALSWGSVRAVPRRTWSAPSGDNDQRLDLQPLFGLDVLTFTTKWSKLSLTTSWAEKKHMSFFCSIWLVGMCDSWMFGLWVRCRRLALVFHPDKNKEQNEEEAAVHSGDENTN